MGKEDTPLLDFKAPPSLQYPSSKDFHKVRTDDFGRAYFETFESVACPILFEAHVYIGNTCNETQCSQLCYTKNDITSSHFNGKHVNFKEIVTHLEFHIVTLAITFHRSLIGYHDFKVVNDMDIKMCFFCNEMMNEIVGDDNVY
jgi:hypothetical protein